MEIKVSSRQENNYLLIKGEGVVHNFEEWAYFSKLLSEEIAKQDLKKIIIDELDMDFPDDLDALGKLVDFISTQLPPEIKFLHLVVVMKPIYKRVGDTWQTEIDKRGYPFRMTYSMEDARNMIHEFV